MLRQSAAFKRSLFFRAAFSFEKPFLPFLSSWSKSISKIEL